LALLDSGIPIKYTFAAVNCAILNNENRVVYFPTLKQEKVSKKCDLNTFLLEIY
jgi:hypothetical protein